MRHPSDLGEMRRRIVRDFLDILILFRLRDAQCATGYDIMNYVQREYHISISPGTAYSTIHSLERKGFVKCEKKSTRAVYSTTSKGEALTRTLHSNLDFLVSLVESLLS